ncbi:MAG: serine/threonine-protein kinase [Bacteroidota bacterium]
MSSKDFARATDLFLKALDQDPTTRTDFLDSACVDDTGAFDAALRREVDALLASHDEADYLEAPLVSREDADPMLGQTLGAWTLSKRIGEGGMGAVYRAERADGTYQRTVALKLLRPGPNAAGLAARMRAERQILASLEHPNIARLYDGGITPRGLPYLALEYIEGVPLTEAASMRSLADRIGLVLQVCKAVAYAHRHLVVHRDLKPSNVLVTDAGQVKLLDFGIATLLDAEHDGLMTVTGAQLLTPAYAAPEQILGQPVTTATDVYALGVLLYEILSGQRPYDLSGRTARDIEHSVCETMPAPPSSVASSETARLLRGDLDTIVMTALTKEPDRRYTNAQALGDDLQRYLDHLPIAARPATLRYRLQSFTRRYRTGVAAGAVAAIALGVGLSVALWQGLEAARARDHAQSQFEIAQDAARALIYDVHDAVAGLPGSTEAREVIVSRSLDYLDRLSKDAGDGEDALRIDLAEAYFRIGNVLGNPTDGNLGRTTDARVSYRHGLAALPPARELATGDTLGAQAESIRGRLYEKLGVVQAHMGQLDSALHHIDLALAAHERAVATDPESPARRTLLATSHINRGDYSGHPHFPSDDQPDVAYDHYIEARRLIEAIPDDERSLFALRMLGITHEREGSLLTEAGDLNRALAALRRSRDIRLQIADRPDATTDARRDVGISHEVIGRVLRQQRQLDAALAEFRRAHAVYTTLYTADPANSNARETLAFGELHLARTFGGPDEPHLGNRAQSREHYRRALELLRPSAEDPANTRMHAIVSETEAQFRAVGG